MSKLCTGCLDVTEDDAAVACGCGRKFRKDDVFLNGAGADVEFMRVESGRDIPRVRPIRRSRGSDSMPAPLADPLRGLRTGLNVLNAFSLLLVAAGALFSYAIGDETQAIVTATLGLLGVLWVFGISRLLPNRPTDILYLRSFRTDDTTGGVRTSLERALDPQFRVSGIRDPRRRWPRVLRFMSYVLFALKYANPKYLNLEAGAEWKGRLWRSLGEAKGVVIDISDLTPAVEAEIRLCVECMGLERMLFVVRELADEEYWRGRIRNAIPGAASDRRIQIAVWHTFASDTAAFEKRVAKFGAQLPDEPAGFNRDARDLAEHLPGHEFEEANRALWVEIGVGLAAGSIGTATLGFLRELVPGFALVLFPFYTIWFAMLAIHYVSFRRNSGSARRRRIAFWTVFPLLVVFPASIMLQLLIPDVGKVRAAAQRMHSSNNLKQIALGMHNYNDSQESLPGANPPSYESGTKKYPVSWRVLLLPYVEGDRLYSQYRFDEPWDGPHNIKLVEMMPKIYRHPMADGKKLPAGQTHYRTFASRPGAAPSAAFTDGLRGPKLQNILDGTSNTILIVEAEEAVPWTMPEILLYDRNQPLPKLGGLFTGGYNAALGDGSVKFFRHTMPESQLRAWITRDGGERIEAE